MDDNRKEKHESNFLTRKSTSLLNVWPCDVTMNNFIDFRELTLLYVNVCLGIE